MQANSWHVITYMVIQENDDDFLDKQLTFLRNIGKGELWPEIPLINQSAIMVDNATNPYSDLFDFSLLQPMLDKKVDRPYPRRTYSG